MIIAMSNEMGDSQVSVRMWFGAFVFHYWAVMHALCSDISSLSTLWWLIWIVSVKRLRDESINISDEKLYPMAQVGFNYNILRNDGVFFFCGFSVVFKSGKLVLSEASLVLWIVSFSALSVKWDIQGRGRERGDHREDVQLCKDDSSYSLVTIKAQMPSNAPSLNPFTRLTFSEETKTLSEFVSQVSVLSLPVFTITF